MSILNPIIVKDVPDCFKTSLAFVTCIKKDRNMTKQEEKNWRDEYEKIMNSSNPKQQFTELSREIKEKMIKEKKQNNQNEQDDEIILKICTKTFKFQKKPFVLIGRHDMCDIVISPLYSSVSRVGAIVFQIGDSLIVIDPGSLYGIRTTFSNNEKQHSMPNSRKPIIIAKNELVVLTMGHSESDGGVVDIAFNPKLCIVCFENSREVISNCGHYSMCEKCYQKVENKCPLCRKEMGNGNKCIGFETKI